MMKSSETTRRNVVHSSNSTFINRRPTVKSWIKSVWIDLLTIAITGGVSLGIYLLKPAPERNFPITFKDGEIVYPDFAYPIRPNIVPIWLSSVISFGVPAIIILLCQIRVRSFWDVNNAIFGVTYSLINAAAFQVFIKWLIGGLRPHFLDVCKPDMTKINSINGVGVGFQNLFFTKSICTGDESEINDSLESMPSGHSTAAFAGFVFLFLYLNAKLKLWSNYHPAYWKMIVVYAPLLVACLIAGSLTIDAFHHWYDCVAGAVIGTFNAVGAYRMTYASIWDWRYNHIPLPRDSDQEHEIPGYGNFGGFEQAVVTRKAGWGSEKGYGSLEQRHTTSTHITVPRRTAEQSV